METTGDGVPVLVPVLVPLLVLGLGCERGASPDEVIGLAEEALRRGGMSARSVSFVSSLDQRRDEPAILAAAAHFAVPLAVFDAAALEVETPRLANPSAVVFTHTGCHGVAEASALACAGKNSILIVGKIKSAHATAALAMGARPAGVAP